MIPLQDVALCIELGQRVILCLMTEADWKIQVRRYLSASQ